MSTADKVRELWVAPDSATAEDRAEKQAILSDAVDFLPAAHFVHGWSVDRFGGVPRSDFDTNMKTVVMAGAVTAKFFGFLVYVPQAYRRDFERDLASTSAAAVAATSDHVGEIKTRMDFGACRITGVRHLNTDYGTSTLITFTTAEGNILKWFASNAPDVVTGSTVSLKGTVKRHGEFRGAKETMINRAVIG